MGASKGICAGIVTYQPEITDLEANLATLMPQVSRVYIVDNGSDNVTDIQSFVEGRPQLRLLCNSENAGIAKALNQLCRQAKQDGYKWILTMDQDSLSAPDMVSGLSAYMDNPVYGIIAPRVEFRDGDTLILSTKDGEKETVEVSACITSGSLTRIEAWEKVGGFDEWFFIDRVDNEFCIHLAVNGYKVLRVNNALMSQKAGGMKYIRMPWGKNILLPYYNEKRNYYICRNSVYLFRKYGSVIDIGHQIMAFIYAQLIKLLFEGNRIKTLVSSVKGIRDGFKKEVEYCNYSSK